MVKLKLFAFAALLGPSPLAPLTASPARLPRVPQEVSPLQVIEAVALDGRPAHAVVRLPPGPGPFPVVMLIHGGLKERPMEWLKETALNEALPLLLLARGYTTVQATFRTYAENPQDPGPLWDCLAILKKVQELPRIDPQSLLVFGESGGAGLSLLMAGESHLAGVAVHEIGALIFTGMATREFGPPTGRGVVRFKQILEHPQKFYTPELQELTRARLRKIGCPIFISHGYSLPLQKLDFEVFLPELAAARKRFMVTAYPGILHPLFREYEGRLSLFQDLVEEFSLFFKPALRTLPLPIDPSLIEGEPVEKTSK